MKLQIVALVLVLVLVIGCISQPPETTPELTEQPAEMTSIADIIADLEGLTIDEFFEESYKQLLLRNPEMLTAMGLAEEYGVGNGQLNNISDAYIRETQNLEAAILDLLHLYDRDTLTPEQQVSYDVYQWYLDDLVRGHEFMYYDYPVHHFLIGYHDNLNRLFTEYHLITDKQDADDYISRLSQVDDQVGQLIEGLKLRKEAGVIPPDFIIEMTRGLLVDYLHMHGPDSFRTEEIQLYTYFSEKVGTLDVSAQEKQDLLDAAVTEIEESFIPAYQRLLDYLDYLAAIATDDAGVWKFPKGDEYYAYMLRKETSTDLTPEEIHQLGLAEVTRIQAEMRTVFDELGYPQDESLDDLVNRAMIEGGYYDTTTQSGKDQVIEAYEALLDEVDQRLNTLVDIHPSAELVIIGELGFGGGGGWYEPASLDGSRPGAFHTGVGGSAIYKYRMPTIAYHEAIPGHHFQIAIAQEMDLPFFRNDIIFNGYAEGWALYAERLAWELGLYDDDPYGNIGRLQLELLRAVRLVADTGIHAMQWTRGEAKAYMKEALGTHAFSGEVDRYIVLPAQATGYKVGMLKILELRQKAMDELGDQFDIKEFHRIILGNGSMPLEILEQIVQDYINAKLSGNADTLSSLTMAKPTLHTASSALVHESLFDSCECNRPYLGIPISDFVLGVATKRK